ncbi:ribosome production factor 2 homolog [Amphiura filiformis]|uniref:ribosome production factor 2 homolog n=1 Tax=Amphiura filiformis TaxID=82378 RepID=UPI003B21E129
MQRVVKPKTQRGKRALAQREPKLVEEVKTAMFIRGGNTSEMITRILKEFNMLRKPHAVMFQKKNMLRPFEDQTQLEFFSNKNDASLFLFGSHSKKRPHNLVMGRLFNHLILDMIELGVDNFKSMYEFQNKKCTMGTKPCLIFTGEMFDTELEYKRLKSLFIDFFRGPVVKNVRLAGLEHILSFSAVNGQIHIRSYRGLLKKSGTKIPRVELEEIGPSLDLTMRRTHLASQDLFKRALKIPKALKPKKKKNISHDVFGTQHGRVHMESQDLGQLQTRKMKALKRKGKQENEEKEKESPKKARTDDDDASNEDSS